MFHKIRTYTTKTNEIAHHQTGQKEAENKNDENHIVADLAKKLNLKINFLQDSLSNITRQLSASCFHTNHVSKDKKLPKPCCSKSREFGRNEGCSVIHLGFNGTRIAKCAADVFNSLKSPNGIIRHFFMTKDRTTHLEFPAAQACGQQGRTLVLAV